MKKMRIGLSAGACLLAMASMGGATLAHAQAAQTEYSIAPQPLASALRQFSLQSGQPILFSDENVRGMVSPPLRGRYSTEAALRRLLKDARLKPMRTADGVILLKPAPAGEVRPIAAVVHKAAVPAPVVQQAEPAPEVSGLAEIVVTAQKREESLQRTPIAIDVVSGEGLEMRGIHTINDFASGQVPAVRATPLAGRPSGLVIGMRGIVPFDAVQISRDNGVGIYIDGVNLGRVQGLGTELFEIDRVEILKGPQGTLFGRNAVGGAISIVSKAPTGELGLRAKAGVRNFNGYNAEAHLDLPEFANLAIKLDGVFSKRGGTVDNPLRGEADYNQYKRYGFHTVARWTPSDSLTADLSFDISRDESTPYYGQLLNLAPGAPPLAPLRRQGLEPTRVRTAAVDTILEPSVGKAWGVSLNALWDIADKTSLRSISAYRTINQTQYDNTGANYAAYRPNGSFGRVSFAGVDQWQVSQEFQLIGSLDRLSYVAGLYYFHENGDESASSPSTMRFNATGTDYTIIPDPFVSPTLPQRVSNATATSKAVFGQFTYTPALLDERLHLTVGGRYTWDRKKGALTVLNGATPVLNGITGPIAFTFRSSRFDPTVNLAADLSDDVHAYVKWGRAYRAGGANARSMTYSPFGEEVASTAEIGLKTEFLDRRVRLNLAAYRTRYTDLQIDFSNPINPSNFETRNTNNPAHIKGVEADLTAQIARGLLLNVNYVYTDVNISPQVNPFTGAVSSMMPVLTPKHAVSGAIDYETSFGPGVLKFHLDAMAQGKTFGSPTATIGMDKRFLLNGRVSLDEVAVAGGQVGVSLWVRNITNEQYLIYTYQTLFPGLIFGDIGYYNEPRTYGVELSYRF